jgi:branched-chain amino acid transport system substrate-binding protein
MAPLAVDGPTMYCLSPGLHPAEGSYAFSSEPSTTDLFIASAVYFRERGLRKIALITSSDATGQDAERGISATFNEKSGVQIVTQEHFNISDVSVAAQMAHIKASGAQAMIAWSTGTPIATILRGIQDAGIDMPVEISNGNLTFAQMHAYASFMPKELIFSAMPAIAADNLPNGPVKRKAVDYISAAIKATGARPDTGYLAAWDPAVLVIEAYKKLGLNATATQIRDYISNLRGWVGIDGTYDFKAIPQRGVGASSVIMVRWDATKDNWVAISKFGGEPLK